MTTQSGFLFQHIALTLVLAAGLAAVPVDYVIAQGQGFGPGEPPPGGDIDEDGVPNFEDSDMDGDGLTNDYEEHETETNPARPDSDGDGLSDSEEVLGEGSSPDGGIIDQTDPNNDDSDGDGWTDAAEREHNTDPNDADETPLGPGNPNPHD